MRLKVSGRDAVPTIAGMLIAPNLAVGPELVPLCSLVLAAERLSMRCAGMQAALARGLPFERMFLAQQRHERGHVALFRSVLAFSRPGGETLVKPLAALATYERRLVSALARGDLAASLVGLQVVLEGIGTNLFSSLTVSPALERIKRAVLLQEEAHHELGARVLRQVRGTNVDSLQAEARAYVDAGRTLLETVDPYLRRAGIIAGDPRGSLPDWLLS